MRRCARPRNGASWPHEHAAAGPVKAVAYAGFLATVVATAAAQQPPATVDSTAIPIPAWVYPLRPGVTAASVPAVPTASDSARTLRVPGSRAVYTAADVRDLFAVPDWHPREHGPMPPIVARGRKPAVLACGYCHLPDGGGRPENAMLAGLPEAYLLAQLAAMRSRARRDGAPGGYLPTRLMLSNADSLSEAEIAAAAAYFARQKPRQRYRVTETTTIPRVRPAIGIHLLDPAGGTEPLDGRIVELPDDAHRHEARDPRATYTSYVPVGSVARGRRIAKDGEPGGTVACATCHGGDLRGSAAAPPIAGRAPSYLLRQLLAFGTGARATPEAMAMQAVAASMDLDAMVAAAAYAGSRRP